MKKEDILKSFAKKLKEERLKKGISQLELSLIVNVSVSTIGKAETGKQDLTMNTVYKISKALGISPSILLDLECFAL